MSKDQRNLIVVGHGRGATSFASAWLIHNGIQAKHETMGRDGIVDSGLSVPTYPIRNGLCEGLTRNAFEFENKLTVVRNPWKTIATYYAVEHPDAIWLHKEYIELDDAADALEAICLSVVRWTQCALDFTNNDYLRAEEWNTDAPTWLRFHRFPNRDWRPVPRDTINHRAGDRLSREEIVARISPRVAQEVKEFAESLGYV